MFRIFFLFISLFFSSQVMANSVNLIINGKAMHEDNKNYNEENYGLGFEYNFEEKNHWITFINGGFFKDSHSNNSNYLGGGIKRRFLLGEDKDGWHIDAGMTAFLMTRKNFKKGQPFFGALPYASIGTSRFAVNATYIPSVSPKLVALWFFQASVTVAEW